MCGIIQREYDHFRKAKGLPVQGVRHITREEGEEIYRSYYWQPYCELMPLGLDLSFFDTSVNEGTHQAIKILQVAVGAANDGLWGPVTLAHIKEISDVVGVIEKFTERRKEVYREMSGFRYFGSDWIRRSTEIGKQSLAMARSVPVIPAPQAVVAESDTLRRLEIVEAKLAQLESTRMA